MTTKTQDAPGQTGQDLNEPQPDIFDAPGQTVAYAIYHPDHGFAETCTSAIEDFTDHQNEGHAILLYRQRDVAAADRLQRNWCDEATIIPVRIPKPGEPGVRTDGSDTDPHVIASRLYKQVQAARNWFEQYGMDHQAEEPCAPIVEKLEEALYDWGPFFIALADRSKGSTD